MEFVELLKLRTVRAQKQQKMKKKSLHDSLIFGLSIPRRDMKQMELNDELT